MSQTLTENGDLPGAASNPPGGSALKDANEWIYSGKEDFTVSFDPKTQVVTEVVCLEVEGDVKKCSSNIGISPDTKEQDVFEILGNPDKDALYGGTRTLEYHNLGIRLMLMKRKIYLISKSLTHNYPV